MTEVCVNKINSKEVSEFEWVGRSDENTGSWNFTMLEN